MVMSELSAQLACLACRSAHHPPNSHPLLLALDDVKLRRSSTAKLHPHGTAQAAAAAAAGSDVNITQPELRSSLCPMHDRPIGAALGYRSSQQAGAMQSMATHGLNSVVEHADRSKSSSDRLLSRSSTLKAAHTMTTFAMAGILSRSTSQQHRQSSTPTAAGHGLRLIQPITVADALARPGIDRPMKDSLGPQAPAAAPAATAAMAAQSTPGISGQRYAGAAAVTHGAGSSAAWAPVLGQALQCERSNAENSYMATPSHAAAKVATLHALRQQQEQLQQMVQQVSLRSRASTPSRLSVRSLPAEHSVAAQIETTSTTVGTTDITGRAGTTGIAAPQRQRLEADTRGGNVKQQQCKSALHNSQQQLDNLQSNLHSSCSRYSSGSTSTGHENTTTDIDQQATVQALTVFGQESRPYSSASTPSPRASQPQPYSAAAGGSGGSPAATASLEKPTLQQNHGSQQTTKVAAQQVADSTAAAAAAAAAAKSEHIPELPGTSKLCASHSAAISAQRVPAEGLDITFSGTVPAGVKTAHQDDNAHRAASDSDVNFHASPHSTLACSTGLFIEPSSTMSGSDATASLTDAVDQGNFQTPHAHIKRHQHLPQQKWRQPDGSVKMLAKLQRRQDFMTSENLGDEDYSYVGDMPLDYVDAERHNSKQQQSVPSCSKGNARLASHQYNKGRRKGHQMQSSSSMELRRTPGPLSPMPAAAMEGPRGGSDSRMVLVVRQHAKQLQQQNDALVRVLEREQEEHRRAKQRTTDAQQQLAESRAEWEVKLQVLRQDKAALHAQLRKAMAGGDQLEVLDAYDAALLASAAKVEEAQAAAASLAAQLVEAELQLQKQAFTTPDAALAAAAVESQAVRCGIHGSNHNIRGPLAALRLHLKHLEQQLAKQQAELTMLQRENIKLLRFKKQCDAATHKLHDAVAAQIVAEKAAHQAGLKAAEAAGKACRLQQQVNKLIYEKQQMQATQHAQHQQMHGFQEQVQGLQCGLCCSSPTAGRIAGSSICTNADNMITNQAAAILLPPATAGAAAGCAQATASGHYRCSGRGSSRSRRSSTGSAANLAGTFADPQLLSNGPADVLHTSNWFAAADHASSSGRQRLRHSQRIVVMSSPRGAADGQAAQHGLQQSASTPPVRDDSGSRAAVLAQQVAMPQTDVALKEQMSSLMSAIAAGVKERNALVKQGQLLLGMVTGTAA